MRAQIVLSATVGLFLSAGPLFAQAAPVRPLLTVGAGGGWFLVGGEDFSATDDAAGVEAYVGYHVAGVLDINAGVHYSSHDVSTSSFDVDLLGVFLEPRFLFLRANAPIGAFLGGRIGWVRRDVSSLSSTGFALGGIAGILIGPDWPVRIEPALTASFMSFSRFFGSGERDTGSAIGIQVGLNVPIHTPGS